MRRTLVFAAATMSIVGGLSFSAEAMPLSPVGNAILSGDRPAVTLVAGGCGVGFHRGPFAGCRPNVGFGPRRVFAPRCVLRRTPFGLRRVCG